MVVASGALRASTAWCILAIRYIYRAWGPELEQRTVTENRFREHLNLPPKRAGSEFGPNLVRCSIVNIYYLINAVILKYSLSS